MIFTTLMGTLLPGARDLRPPLIAGLLWSLVAWLAVADHIPERDGATGFAGQLYGLADAGGPFFVISMATVLVFVIGALAVTATKGVAGWLGSVQSSVLSVARLQRHAQRQRKQATKDMAALERQLAAGEGADTKSRNTERRLHQGRELLGVLPERPRYPGVPWRWHQAWIRKPEQFVDWIGSPPQRAGSGLEFRMVKAARLRGMTDALDDAGLSAELDHVDDLIMRNRDKVLVEQLQQEVSRSPLDALAALDPILFNRFDRERAEREVRTAAAAPIIAVSIWGAFAWSPWVLVAAAVASWTYVDAGTADSQEASRVLDLVQVHELMPPALKAAEAAGRAQAREYIRRIRQDEVRV